MYINQERINFTGLFNYFGKITGDFPDYKDERYRSARALKLSKLARFVIAKNAEGEVVGMIAFYMTDGKICYITHVSVLVPYKRQGIFKTMYFLVERMAREQGYSLVKLEVRKNNKLAINGYLKQGFIFNGDSDRDNVYMCKTL